MTFSAADEKTFILSDEIIELIYTFSPPPNDHEEKTNQACGVLQALINVISTVLSEIDCSHCRGFTIKALEMSFAQMLSDIPAVRAELEGEQRTQSIH